MTRIIVFKDKKGEHRWRLRAHNGKIIATSGEGYKRKSGAEKAAHRLTKLDWSKVYFT